MFRVYKKMAEKRKKAELPQLTKSIKSIESSKSLLDSLSNTLGRRRGYRKIINANKEIQQIIRENLLHFTTKVLNIYIETYKVYKGDRDNKLLVDTIEILLAYDNMVIIRDTVYKYLKGALMVGKMGDRLFEVFRQVFKKDIERDRESLITSTSINEIYRSKLY